MADIETDAIMTEAELLAALRGQGRYASSDMFNLDDDDALSLLRSQIAAHRREERERCQREALEVWAAHRAQADKVAEYDEADAKDKAARLETAAQGALAVRDALRAPPTSEPENNG